MMISPEGFIHEYEEMTYAELLPVKEKLILGIMHFEKKTYDPSEDLMRPSPEVVYQCRLMYLAKLCELIADKYNREFVWDEEDDV